MTICKSLLKYGYSGFSLEILEYCDSSALLTREKHFMGLIKPVYNITIEPSHPFFGRKHSDETRAKMSDALNAGHFKKGEMSEENNPFFGKTHSDETRKKISEAKKGISLPKFTEEHKSAISAALEGKNKGENSPRKVLVIDVLTNESTSYPSMREAAQSLNIKYSVISNFISRNQSKPYKGKYIFKVI